MRLITPPINVKLQRKVGSSASDQIIEMLSSTLMKKSVAVSGPSVRTVSVPRAAPSLSVSAARRSQVLRYADPQGRDGQGDEVSNPTHSSSKEMSDPQMHTCGGSWGFAHGLRSGGTSLVTSGDIIAAGLQLHTPRTRVPRDRQGRDLDLSFAEITLYMLVAHV